MDAFVHVWVYKAILVAIALTSRYSLPKSDRSTLMRLLQSLVMLHTLLKLLNQMEL